MTPSLALVLVGDELLQGRTVDANGAHLARRCADVGVRLVHWRTVRDDETEIACALVEAAAVADVVVAAGGLGPTDDDRTRAGLARALGVALVHDEGAWRLVTEALEQRGRAPVPAQRGQALLPRGTRALPNPEGTAPGIAADLGRAAVLLLPGVPREFRAMVESAVIPTAARRGALAPRPGASLFVAGRTEADVGEALGDLWATDGVTVGSYPHDGEIELRFTGESAAAGPLVERAAAEAARRLGDAAVGPRPLAQTVVELLCDRRLRLAVAESMTGGLLGAMLTDVAGASETLLGGWIVYSDEAKERSLGVPAETLAREGAVSQAACRAMLAGVFARSSADVALAVTGSAGPAPAPGPSGPVPAGTAYVGAALRGGDVAVDRLVLGGLPRAVVRRRVALAALDRLRRLIPRGAG